MAERSHAEQPSPQLHFILPDPDITKNNHGGNRESAAAHRRVAPNKATTRERIMDYAASKKGVGITADEVASA